MNETMFQKWALEITNQEYEGKLNLFLRELNKGVL